MSGQTYDELTEKLQELEKQRAKALKSEALAKVNETIKAAEEAQKTINNVVAETKKTIDVEVSETKRVLEESKGTIQREIKAQLATIQANQASLEKAINALKTKLKALDPIFCSVATKLKEI